MNIETPNINFSKKFTKSNNNNNQVSSINFADELKELDKKTDNTEEKINETEKQENIPEVDDEKEDVEGAIEELNKVVEELNQSDENNEDKIKKDSINTDNKDMINNDLNIDDKNILPQMNPNMNFNSNGQPFSSFMNENSQSQNGGLFASATDLAEEAAILSTMAENLAIANKNNIVQNEKTVTTNEGVKKIDTKTNITIENIVRFDSIIMNQADVEVFTQLVQNGSINMNTLSPEAAQRGIQVSKTLSDMLAKSMESNQPLRIDFDNNISVIIKISRDGKITADFLPSSQIAEAYLKENLPLLRQKFDNENIKYNELNQRERREQHREQNNKKGNNNE